MKTILKISVLGMGLALLFTIDVPPKLPLQVELVPTAHAIFGVRRRAWRRGVVVGASVASADYAASASHQQAASTQQQSAPPPQPAAAPPPAPAPAATGQPLPLGTVVKALPSGCTSTPVGGVDYFYCGGNFYRAAFQGNEVVYVTAKP